MDPISQIRPAGMNYFDPVTQTWMPGEPAVEDSSFLPYGAEDWINPAGWSRAIAKKLTARAAGAVANAAVREVEQVGGKALAKEGLGLIDRMRKSGLPEKTIADLANTAARNEPVQIASTAKGLQATFKVGDPVHQELAAFGRQVADQAAPTLEYGARQATKPTSLATDALQGAKELRLKQVMGMLNPNQRQSSEAK